MFLSKLQFFVVVVAFVSTVHCAKWPRPPKYSSESISTSLSSEEYHGGSLPPLQLGGVPLPPVNSNNVPLFPTHNNYQPPHPLANSHFTELVKANQLQINEAAGPNLRLSHITKVKQIPVPDAEMYYVKGYFNNQLGYRSKCTFFIYSKESVAKVMDLHCH